MTKMIREDMKTIILIRCNAYGNIQYENEVKMMLREQMECEDLYIASDGNLYEGTSHYGEFLIYVPETVNKAKYELCSLEEKHARVEELTREIYVEVKLHEE